jgi:hypothetical protein
MSDCDIEFLLREWAKWSRGGLGGHAAKSSIWGKSSAVAPDISDDMALCIDAAVVVLGVDYPMLRHVLELAYLRGLGGIEIGVRLRVNRHKAERYLAEARGFISGRLSNYSKAA